MILSKKASVRLAINLVLAFFVTKVSSHGRLIEPPSRASMWRFDFQSPKDYNDHETNCGGYGTQWSRNEGKCGICGDPWNEPIPRKHEIGGVYTTGEIVRRYRTGEIIPVHVELTTNHRGYFEFRICPMTYSNQDVTQDCLDKVVLKNEHGGTKFYPVPDENRVFEMNYKLPDGFTCTHCVFQWKYIAGNNWGTCENGTEGVGCGPQEEFRACADILIGDNEIALPPRPETTTKHPSTQPSSTESTYVPESSTPVWLFNLVIAGTCLLVILAALAMVYTYYYHAEKAKKWLMLSRWRGSEKPPVAPPRTKRHSMLSDNHLQL